MTPDSHIADLGAQLRAARERQGLSLQQIATTTKISIGILDALERNDISRLPAGIFVRGFVRAFAREVRLDPEGAVQDYTRQFRVDDPPPAAQPSSAVEDYQLFERQRRVASWLFGLVAAVLIIAAAVIYFFTGGRKVPFLATMRSLTAATAARLPMSGRSSDLTLASLRAPDAAPNPPASDDLGSATGLVEDGLVVRVTATRPCRVSLTVDGEPAVEHPLQFGEQRTVDVHRDLVLTTTDAGALAMTINGMAAAPLGKSGEIATARVNLTNFKTFLPVQ